MEIDIEHPSLLTLNSQTRVRRSNCKKNKKDEDYGSNQQSFVTIKLYGRLAASWTAEKTIHTDSEFIEQLLEIKKKYEYLIRNCICNNEIQTSEKDIQNDELFEEGTKVIPISSESEKVENDQVMNIEIDGADSEYQVSDGDNFDSDSPESEDDFEDNDIAKNSIHPIHPFCTLCNKPINKGQKELHILSEHFILHVECKICKETTGNNNSDRETINHLIPLDNYFDHLTTSHQENLNCHSCKSKYMLKNDTYRNHFLKKHLKDILCRCIECEKQNGINSSSTHINKDNLVKAHSVKGHLQGMHTPEGQGRFPCNICGLLLTKKSLPRHIKNLHTDKTLDDNNLCDICGKYFSQLKRHKRIHIPLNERIKDKNYLCKTCGKAFSNAYNLRVHSRLHTGEKPYVCDVCGKGFCQNVELRLHTKNHHDKTKTRSKKQKKKENRPVSVNSTSDGHILQNIRFVEENTVTTEDPNQTISQIPAENHVLEMHPQHGAEIHQEPLYAVLTTSYSGSSEAILCANNIQEQTFLQVTNTVETNTNDRDW